MAQFVEIKVDLRDQRKLLRKLSRYEDRVQRRVLKSVFTVGVQPIVSKAKKIAPVGTGLTPRGTPRDHLGKTVVKKAKLYKNTGIVNVTIGTDAKRSPHGHLILGGVKPHGYKTRGGKHPGLLPNNFLEKAAKMAAPAVRAKMRTQLAKRMTAEAEKLARQ